MKHSYPSANSSTANRKSSSAFSLSHFLALTLSHALSRTHSLARTLSHSLSLTHSVSPAVPSLRCQFKSFFLFSAPPSLVQFLTFLSFSRAQFRPHSLPFSSPHLLSPVSLSLYPSLKLNFILSFPSFAFNLMLSHSLSRPFSLPFSRFSPRA